MNYNVIPMKLSLRLALFLVLGISLITFVTARYQVQREKSGLRADLEKRAEILAESLQEVVEPTLQQGSGNQLHRIVDRFGNRERLAGVFVYDDRGNTLAKTSNLQARFT